MESQFGIERERINSLYYTQFTNDRGNCHFHSQIELCFVDEGRMDITVNGQRKRLKAGEMSVALSYDAHIYTTVGSSKSSILVIPSYLCEVFLSAVERKRLITPFICDPGVVSTIKSYVQEIRQEGINEVKLHGYINVILGLILDNISLTEVQTPIDNDLSTQLLFYLNENYKSDISLNTLSSVFGYRANYISRYFKSCFGIGICRYISLLRLRNALLLMHKKKYSHTYCALESGFNSVRTFYRVFQNEFHCAPRDYSPAAYLSE